jgi:hypothetical protein
MAKMSGLLRPNRNIRKGLNVLCDESTFNHYQFRPYFYLINLNR